MLDHLNSTTACATFIKDDRHFSFYTTTNAMLAIAAGEVITAIKILRRLDNHGLKEAKDIVEACIKGGHDRTIRRQGDVTATLGTSDAGTYYVVNGQDGQWAYYSRAEAEAAAKDRACGADPQYVVKLVTRVDAVITITKVD